MRLLIATGPDGEPGRLVLRTFTSEFFRRHAPELLGREAGVLDLLGPTGVPAPRLLAVDPEGAECADPSLLMTWLPGALRLDDEGAAGRADRLARLLVTVHGVVAPVRPRAYQAWTSPERVTVPPGTQDPDLWRWAVDVIRRPPPAYDGCFLHRDFHPGNVLWSPGDEPGVTALVDWVETSWGPPDLDVAHCATALSLLHGTEVSERFVAAYREAGGRLADPADHAYWRVLDALGFAPDAGRVAGPWRDVGRDDLTPEVATARLEDHLRLARLEGSGAPGGG